MFCAPIFFIEEFKTMKKVFCFFCFCFLLLTINSVEQNFDNLFFTPWKKMLFKVEMNLLFSILLLNTVYSLFFVQQLFGRMTLSNMIFAILVKYSYYIWTALFYYFAPMI